MLVSSKERVLTAVRHEEPDHVPLNIDVHPSYVDYDPIASGWTDQFVVTDFLLELGTDPFICIWLPDPCPAPEVTIREWKETDPQTGQTLLGKEYQTPAGNLRQVIRETPDLYTWHRINRKTLGPLGELIDGVGLLEDVNPSRSAEFLINDMEDLERMAYLFNPPCGKMLEEWREAARFARSEAEKRQVLLWARRTYCGSAILWLTDTERFIVSLHDQPEFAKRFLRIIQDWQCKMLDIVLDVGVDVVTRFGYYDTTDFWGVRPFKECLAPLLQEECAIVHQAGACVSQQQSAGLTAQVDLWKDINVDILRDVDPVQGGEDLACLKRELGDRKTLWGAVNTDLMLANASSEEIRRTVSETVELMAPGGGFVMAPIPALYAGVPWEKMWIMIDAWKACRDYPVSG